MKDKLLISGSYGFVGSNLFQYLNEKNHSLIISSLGRKDLECVNQKVLRGANTILHLAGKAHDLKKVSNPGEYYQVNFQLTKNLFDVFLNSAAKKFIFISSVKAAADEVDGILTESLLPNPQTHYGKSKLMAEQYIQSQPLPAGKSYYILRPCMIHGPRNKGNLNLLYQVVKKGIPYPLAGFHNKRSFLSVENLCFIIQELITRDDIESGIYHVADDEGLSTNEVVSILAASLNKKAQLWNISPKVITFFAKIGDMLHLPLTTERLSKLTESYIVSNAKIKAAINKKLPLNAKEGLQRTAASFSKV
jgi:nucleoside-diphosphate-sugar epimerase